MNKLNTIQKKKAGFITCLFLCLSVGNIKAQNDWVLSPQLSEAYNLTLNLQIEEARKRVPDPKSPEEIYIASLGDILELLLTEDEGKFEKFENEFETRLELLESASTPSALFSLAELRLQWAFVYLKFGNEFDAAWNIRQAYFKVRECKQKFPDFLPAKKTSGVLEIMFGSVPEKYQWVINLLGMEGSVDKGLKELEEVKHYSNTFHLEASLLYYLIQGYILQHTETAVNGLHDDLQAWSENRLAIFFRAALAIKNSQSEKALSSLLKLKADKTGLPVTYVYYQLGEVYLHKGEYELAIQSYATFLNEYHGLNYVKDACYKIGICHWLSGDVAEASIHFNKAMDQGKEATEADKYAARSLAEENLPNVKLSKIRYATDGGYYDEAKKIAAGIHKDELATAKEKIEFVYRKARLYDKSGSVSEAEKLYQETIDLQGEENWYFAPNSCLQLGYIFVNKNNSKEARHFFEKALSYKKHEYKNSIDSKAKSALAQLK